MKSLDDLDISLDKVKSWIRESSRYNVTKPGIYRKLAPVGERKGEYFLYVPTSYTPKKQWPAIVALHGVGESGYNQIRLWLSALHHNDEYIIIAPTYGSGLWWKEEAEQMVNSVINDVLKSFPINTNRMYLTGFSSGGHAAWYFAIRYPWLFAAINPIAGECPLPSLMSNLMHVPVYILHGVRDSVIPVEAARDAYARLQKLNYFVQYKELPEQTHSFPISETKAMLDWFRDKQRVVYPKKITFTTDSTKYTICYWIEITGFSEFVGHIYGMQRDEYGRLRKSDELPEAAQVKAYIHEQTNEINVSSYGVKALRLYLDDEMIDTKKPLHILINGKTVFLDTINVSIRSILETAKQRNDRKALFSKFIDLKVNP
ncbi:MAG: dienelactone hydrolase family protein [Candidatus Scalindua rubra]|nr:dienelactone hydrolase family protein [Candidatus Scalindua rubra]